MSRRNLEQLKADCKAITQLLNILDTLNEKIKNHQTQDHKSELAKRVQGITEYQYRQRSVLRNPDNDRVVPIETIDREQFRLKYAAQLSNVTLHYGEYSDELTRSMNLLALTIGTDIYFRNGAYKPETEEGRALLAHEMTHVAQYTEKRIHTHTDTKELENEAVYAEKSEYYESDPVITKVIQGIPFRIRKSKEAWLHNMIKEKLETLIEQYCAMQRDDKKKLKLLTTYMDLQKNGGFEAWLK